MILLSGHSLTPEKRIPLVNMSLHLDERESTAEIVPAYMSGITMQSWMKDDTEPGAGIVWRVRSIQQNYSSDTPSVQLEHAINSLRDRIMFGEITPATIKGVVGATTCTAQEAITYILAQQSDWTLGSFSYGSVANPYKFDGDNLYDALEKVTETLDDAWWSYDFSVYPFLINITTKPAGVTCELRPGRNLTTISKTIDRSGMYTRFYPIGKDDLHISGNYVSKNESTYGVISRVEVDQSLTTESELTAWANERLAKHAQPTVNITAEGLELADATGESLDRLTLGRLCRIPLYEFNTTITERIVELNYQDKINAPEVVQITMANTREDVTRLIADVIKRGGSGGRGAARQQAEDHAWFEDTDEYVAMVAEKTGINSLGESETLYGRIQVEAGKISQIVSAVGSNGQVTAASIMLAINGDTSSVKISADEIDINGIVTALAAKAVGVGSLTVEGSTDFKQGIYAEDTIYTEQALSSGTYVEAGSYVDAATYVKAGTGFYVGNSELKLLDASVSNNTLTITKIDGTTVTFSKAVSLSGEWSGSVSAGKSYKVTASPGGQTHYSPSLDGMAASASSKTWASDYKSFDQEISVYDSNSEDLYKETLTFNTTASWNAGSNAAGVVIDASNGEVKVAASTSTKSVAITADVVATYNSTTHKYSVRGIAKAGSTQMDSVTDLTGTEAYDAGVIDGQGAVYTGVTAREVLSSGGTTYYPASSTTVVGRGDSVSAMEVLSGSSGGTMYYQTANEHRFKNYSSDIELWVRQTTPGGTYTYTSAGKHSWWYTGAGSYYYTRSGGKRLKAEDTYYKGNGGTKTVQGGTAIHLGGEETLYRRS